MIAALLRLAEQAGLSGCESQRRRPVHWFVDLDEHGNALNLSPTTSQVFTSKGQIVETRGKKFNVSANYHMQWKDEKIQSVCTNQHNWLPDFLTGPVEEIFNDGLDGENKARKKRRQFWRLVFEAYREKPQNKAIRAVWLFLRSRPQFTELPLPVDARANLDWFRKKPTRDGDTLSFRVGGRIVLADTELREWWANRYVAKRTEITQHLGTGFDLFLPGEGCLTEYFPTVFDSVPFASFNKAPFRSFGLGSQTATFRLETAERATAGLNALLDDPNASMQLGDETAAFWAVEKISSRQVPADFMQLLDQPDPLAVQDYLRGIWGTRPPEIAAADFHVAILLKGTGRFSVRSWQTDPLGQADQHVRRYFEAIALPESEAEFPALRDLAWATIAKTKKQKTKPAPVTYNALFEAAWRGRALPFDLLAATIERQRVELASGDPDNVDFKARLATRTALIQLYFALKPNDPIRTTRELIMNTKETAILCGRLLALLDKIHEAAHDGKSASSPANRLYGAASATPALVFPRLCQLARYHLQKMEAWRARMLEFGVPKDRRDDGGSEDFEGLAAVVARLNKASDGDFPRTLPLEDQGRFALGFYYERNRKWPNYKPNQVQTQTA